MQVLKFGGAVASGGALWKFVDLVLGRRKRRIADEGELSKHAMVLVDRLDTLNVQVQDELKIAQKEREECLARSMKLEDELLDLKRWFKIMYEHMASHMRNCEHPEELPPLPKNITK